MTILIKMRGEFEKIPVQGDQETFLHEMNLAAAQGKEFVLMEKPDGHMLGISTHNMLTFEEVEDADLVG